MAKQHDSTVREQRGSRLTGSSGPIVMTDEELDQATRPAPPAAASSSATDATPDPPIEADASVSGVASDGTIAAEVVELELSDLPDPRTRPPEEIQREEMEERKRALKQYRIRPRITQRMRVPHPSGRQALWLNLTKGQEMVVPGYVRDHLYEKGVL